MTVGLVISVCCVCNNFNVFQDQTVSNLSKEIAARLGLKNRKAYISSHVSTHNPVHAVEIFFTLCLSAIRKCLRKIIIL